jgi:hypothetical protein
MKSTTEKSSTHTVITFEVDTFELPHQTDAYLAQLWHIAQANPAPYGDMSACWFMEHVGREIIRRWLADTPPVLWDRQMRELAFAFRSNTEA